MMYSNHLKSQVLVMRRNLCRTAALAQGLEDKLAHQKQTRELERRRNNKRKELFDA